MDSFLSNKENVLFQLLRQGLFPGQEEAQKKFEVYNWNEIIKTAERQGVLSLLYTELCEKQELQDSLKQVVEKAAEQTALHQYRLLFLGRYVLRLFEEQKISAVLMKGVTVGSYYPVPELRKSGDIDLLLLQPTDLEAAKAVMKQAGCVEEEQHALHHVCFSTQDGIEVELHTMLAEPFDNEKTNTYLKGALERSRKKQTVIDVMGVKLPVLPGAYYPFELLLHMLQHFLRSGFGLKLLCDWVMFWQKGLTEEEQELYLDLVEEAGIKGFSDVVTLTCIRFFGLAEPLVSWMNMKQDYPVEEFLREILDAEEFGNSNKNRMVVMRGAGLFDYIREFHHQMHLNFPRAGRCVLLWPVLWTVTLFRFLRNNRKLRKVSTKSVLKEAKRRSQMMKKLKLFQ